jgi:hypothetical protein
MSRREEKAFNSAKEIIQTYFPSYSREKDMTQADRDHSPYPDLGGKLAEEFAANLRKKSGRK